MAGISSKAAGSLENKKKYNGIEWENDLDLAVYDAFFRELDPQTGRWWQIDPKIENMEAWSPYASNFDNPVSFSDPLGDEPEMGGSDDPPSTSTRIWGAVKVVGGLAEMVVGAVGGAATSWTGIGAVVGGAAVVHGADNFAAGLTQLFSGNSTQTFTEQGISKGLQATGVSQQTANTVAGYADFGIGIALTAGAGAAANGSKAETITLYRGVNESHAGFGNATKGTAVPKGGNATAAQHNAGNTASKYSSWTTNKDVAINYAKRPSGNGVVMSKTVKSSSVVKSPSAKNVVLKQSGKKVNESEVLLKGKVKNAKVEYH